ncbi:polysaccharide deacetylase family protein [Moritella sp. 5]|uniref:polysaccharide deacetylase family protein n=1 Tax=Moritella sp. 5 TaxID=2746231 RepID=UPI001BAC1CFD|nr:polysaccharide deacetylase family protein [Moritella sp. 5]QUM79394.1 polysaccharide deacetylase family protein [Moritella sp. 5]
MKKEIRNFIIGSLYVVADFIFRGLHNKNIGKTRIIVFHHIDSLDIFESLISKISLKYNVISFEDYVRGNISKSKVNVIISLDDGYESWYLYGLPIFNKYNIKPILSVNSDFIGLNVCDAKVYCKNNIKTWQENSLDWDELRVLYDNGAMICGHSWSHIDMISNALTFECKVGNIQKDKNRLEEKIGTDIDCFTYPFGRYNSESLSIVSNLGFKFAFTSDSNFISPDNFPYQIPRTNIGMRNHFVAFGYIEGWGEWLTKQASNIRKLSANRGES